LHASYDIRRVNHSVEYKAEDGANVNRAESYFSRLRRAEIGQHHRISGHLLHQCANEAAWREGQPPQAERYELEYGHQRCARRPEESGLDGLLAPERSMTTHVVSNLIEKRRELAGIIDELQRQLDQHLTHIARIPHR
jgi:ISXO2-like transposase domain